jgi:hypothetical protein
MIDRSKNHEIQCIALTNAVSRCARPGRGKVIMYFSRFAVARSAIGHWLVQTNCEIIKLGHKTEIYIFA